jgi:hypothetical protein
MKTIPTASTLLAAMAIFATPSWACVPAEIEIRQIEWRRRPPPLNPDEVDVVGELINKCAEPTGVRLQLTFRDADGKVVDVFEGWPASTRNIEAGASYAFKISFKADVRTKSMDTKVLEVRRWRER